MRYLSLLLFVVLLTACFDSESDVAPVKGPPSSVQLAYVHQVEGLSYQLSNPAQGLTDGHRAQTSDLGKLGFVPGDRATLFVRNLRLGDSELGGRLTPLDWNDDTEVAIGQTGLLFICDQDRNLSNGIQISAQFCGDQSDQSGQWPIPDFTAPDLAVEFAQQLSEAQVDGPNPIVPTRAAAQAYLQDRMACLYSGFYEAPVNSDFSDLINPDPNNPLAPPPISNPIDTQAQVRVVVLPPLGRVLAQVEPRTAAWGGVGYRDFPADTVLPLQRKPSVTLQSTPSNDFTLTLTWSRGELLNINVTRQGNADALNYIAANMARDIFTPRYRFVFGEVRTGVLMAVIVSIDATGRVQVTPKSGAAFLSSLSGQMQNNEIHLETDSASERQVFSARFDPARLVLIGRYTRGNSNTPLAVFPEEAPMPGCEVMQAASGSGAVP